MAELHDILESEEMRDVVMAIEALKLKFGAPANSSERPWPVALSMVGRYKANEVLRLLLDDKEYYPGYKQVIAAAFGGWLLAPRAALLRKILMVEAALAIWNAQNSRPRPLKSLRSRGMSRRDTYLAAVSF